MLVFMALTIGVVLGGVEDGIERWSRRLMPLLIVTLIALSGYVLTLEEHSRASKSTCYPISASYSLRLTD